MGRVALVTGGSRGIGAAISKALKDAGYTVAANYAGNDEAAKTFTDETGIKTYKWSVADYDACAAGIKQVEADLGPVEVLVNNAGITRDAMFHKMTPQQWKEVIDTNLTGVFNMTHPVWGGMRDRKFGRDRHHLLDQRPEGPGRPGELLGRQGRRHRLHQGAGPGGRARRHHRQRDRPGYIATEMVQGDRREGAERADHPADPGRPPRRARGDRPHRRLPRLRRRRLHHRLDDLGQRRPVLRLTRVRAPRRGVPSGFGGRARPGPGGRGRAG